LLRQLGDGRTNSRKPWKNSAMISYQENAFNRSKNDKNDCIYCQNSWIKRTHLTSPRNAQHELRNMATKRFKAYGVLIRGAFYDTLQPRVSFCKTLYSTTDMSLYFHLKSKTCRDTLNWIWNLRFTAGHWASSVHEPSCGKELESTKRKNSDAPSYKAMYQSKGKFAYLFLVTNGGLAALKRRTGKPIKDKSDKALLNKEKPVSAERNYEVKPKWQMLTLLQRMQNNCASVEALIAVGTMAHFCMWNVAMQPPDCHGVGRTHHSLSAVK